MILLPHSYNIHNSGQLFLPTIKHKVVTFIMTESVISHFETKLLIVSWLEPQVELYNAFCGPAGMSDLDLDANNPYFVGKIIW